MLLNYKKMEIQMQKHLKHLIKMLKQKMIMIKLILLKHNNKIIKMKIKNKILMKKIKQ